VPKFSIPNYENLPEGKGYGEHRCRHIIGLGGKRALNRLWQVWFEMRKTHPNCSSVRSHRKNDPMSPLRLCFHFIEQTR